MTDAPLEETSDEALAAPPRARASLDFTEGLVRRHIVKLSAFMALGFSSWVVASMFEAVFLGILGTAELAAVGFANPIAMVLTSVPFGLGTGASSVIARTVGGGDRARVRRLCTHALVLGLAVMLLLALLGIFFSHHVFRLMGANAEIRVLIDQYMFIWLMGVPIFSISTLNTSLLRAAGDATVPGLVMTLGSVLQVLIAPLLIFGLWGLPALGIRGAALGFVIARLISMLVGFGFLLRERLLVLSFDGMLESWRSILHVGLPSVATSLVNPFVAGVITRLLAGYGPAVVAGYSVAMRAHQFLMMVLMASGAAAGPFIGMNWGAHKYDRVQSALRLVNQFSLVWGFACFVVLLVSARQIVLLINQDPLVVQSAVLYLMIVPISIAFSGLQNVASNAFNALGMPLPAMVLSLARMAVLYLPLAIVGEWLFGYVGIFIALSITTVVVGLWAWRWSQNTIRQEITLRG